MILFQPETEAEVIVCVVDEGSAVAIQILRIGVAPLRRCAVALGAIYVVVVVVALGARPVVAVGIVVIGQRCSFRQVLAAIAGPIFIVDTVLINLATAVVIEPQATSQAIFRLVAAAVQPHIFTGIQFPVALSKSGDRLVFRIGFAVAVNVFADGAYIYVQLAIPAPEPDFEELRLGLVVVAGHQLVGDAAPQGIVDRFYFESLKEGIQHQDSGGLVISGDGSLPLGPNLLDRPFVERVPPGQFPAVVQVFVHRRGGLLPEGVAQ